MALDLYQACPCHRERKLKFCCGKDVVVQLGKALELMDGEQRLKAADVLDQAINKYGHRDCLVTMRFGMAMEGSNPAIVHRLCQDYEKENGETSVGFAMKAIEHLEEEQLDEAIDAIQRALETGEVPSALLEDAILSLAVRLSLQNHFIAGRDHAALYQAVSGDPRGMAQSLIRRMMGLPSLPLVLKHDWPMVDPPDGEPWSREVAQAIHWAQQGLWRKAYEVVKPLADQHSGQPILQKNAAVLAARLARTDEAAAAWKRYARCNDVPHDHAVEGELMYLLLSHFSDSDKYSEVEIGCEISDYEALLESLAKDQKISHVPGAEEEFAGSGGEAPNAVYALLDRTELESAEAVGNPKDIPNVIALIQLYGKRTDREARVVLVGNKDSRFEEGLKQFFQDHPTTKSETANEKTLGETPCLFEDFDWKWRTPESATGEQVADWCEQYWDYLTTEVLPSYRTELLEGKTFSEAAQDPALRNRVEAVLLHLGNIHAEMFDRRAGVQRAREAMGLPAAESIDPKTIRLQDMTLHQFARLDFSKMPVDMLAWAFEAASVVNNLPAIEAIYHDIRRRVSEQPESVEQFPLASLNAVLARLEPRPDKVRQLLTEGDQFVGNGEDEMARWCMQAFAISMEKRQPDLALEYFQRMSVSPMSQPMQLEFARLCSRLGIQPHRGAEAMNPSMESPQASPILSGGTGGYPTEALAAEVEPAAETSESKLWLPGME